MGEVISLQLSQITNFGKPTIYAMRYLAGICKYKLMNDLVGRGESGGAGRGRGRGGVGPVPRVAPQSLAVVLGSLAAAPSLRGLLPLLIIYFIF